MSFRCNKLCSELCCAHLRWALARFATVTHVDVDAILTSQPLRGDAICAIADVAKLVELHTLALSARGFDNAKDFDDSFAPIDQFRAGAQDNGETVIVIFRRKGMHRLGVVRMTLSRARALLAAIMLTSANESSCDAVEALLRCVA